MSRGRAWRAGLLPGLMLLAAGLAPVAAGPAAAQGTAAPGIATPGLTPPGASACSGCHAPRGDGPVPPLLGRPAEDIVAAMRAFRGGQRSATVMDRIAKGFSDDEVRAIAGWLSAGKAGTP